MGLFDKIKEPVFLKNDSEAEQQLAELQKLKEKAVGDLAEQLDDEIRQVNAGVYGENAVHFELENSHIPMFVLHDLYLEHDSLTAQIDYLIVTRKHIFVIECKNLYGNIEINSAGDFIRTVSYRRRTKKEGIYSPITQNRRHMELIKQVRSTAKGNFLTKAMFEKYFYEGYRSIVVLANPKTVLYDRYAKKEVKSQVIKVDQLSEYIRKIDAEPNSSTISEKDMEELAHFFLDRHTQPKVDYAAKFRADTTTAPITTVSAASVAPTPERSPEPPAPPTPQAEKPSELLCPKCGATMIRRKAAKGPNAGKEFYGCSNFPKCRCIINIQ